MEYTINIYLEGEKKKNKKIMETKHSRSYKHSCPKYKEE
jgi:hypothetical protein